MDSLIEKIPPDLEQFLNRRQLFGQPRQVALENHFLLLMDQWLQSDTFVQWAYRKSATSQVFADCFFEPGKVRLLWKDYSIQDHVLEKQINEALEGLGVNYTWVEQAK